MVSGSQNTGGTWLSLLQMSPFELLPFRWKKRIAAWLFTGSKRAKLYDKMAELLDNDVIISSALDSIRRRSAEKNPHSVMTFMLAQVVERFSVQSELAYALYEYIPVMDRVLIAMGEQSSKLSDALRTAALMINRSGRIQGAILKSVSYPIFLMLGVFCVIYYLGTSFFPGIASLVPLENWPATSRNVYYLSQVMTTYWVLELGLLTGLIALIAWSMPNFTGKFRITLDRIPPWSLYRLVIGATWLLSYSSLISAGRQSKDGLLDIMKQSKKNKWLYQRTQAVYNNLSRGLSIGDAINTPYNFPDKELVYDLGDYARLSNFMEIMKRLGVDWIEGVVKQVEEQAEILKTVFFLMAAGCVGLTVQSVFGIMGPVLRSISNAS